MGRDTESEIERELAKKLSGAILARGAQTLSQASLLVGHGLCKLSRARDYLLEIKFIRQCKGDYSGRPHDQIPYEANL